MVGRGVKTQRARRGARNVAPMADRNASLDSLCAVPFRSVLAKAWRWAAHRHTTTEGELDDNLNVPF